VEKNWLTAWLNWRKAMIKSLPFNRKSYFTATNLINSRQQYSFLGFAFAIIIKKNNRFPPFEFYASGAASRLNIWL
jgi:hypothetical protein